MKRFILTLGLLAWTGAMSSVYAFSFELGQGTARWGFLKLYEARLFAEPGIIQNQLLQDDTPLRLELCYARSLSVDNFVDGANHALPKDLSAELQQAVDRLHRAYRPVKEGDCYRLEHQPNQGTQLLLNGESLVTITTPGFKAVYFGIWLGDQPLSERLRDDLLKNL
jgi:hypothetical protein